MDILINDIIDLQKQLKNYNEIRKTIHKELWKSELKLYLKIKENEKVDLTNEEIKLKNKTIKKVENKLKKKIDQNK